MSKGIMFLCSLLFIGIADCMSQKKTLDMEAYKLWRRVEGQQMSEDGKWVTYRFVYIDQEGHDKDVPVTYLRNMTSGKVYELPNVREVSFFNRGKGLSGSSMAAAQASSRRVMMASSTPRGAAIPRWV